MYRLKQGNSARLRDHHIGLLHIAVHLIGITDHLDILVFPVKLFVDFLIFPCDHRNPDVAGVVEFLVEFIALRQDSETAAHDQDVLLPICLFRPLFPVIEFRSDRDSVDVNLRFLYALFRQLRPHHAVGNEVAVCGAVDPLGMAADVRNARNQRHSAARDRLIPGHNLGTEGQR